MLAAVARPSPAALGLVVKNGSKARSRCSASMPLPVSANAIRTKRPPAGRSSSWPGSRMTLMAVTARTPPRGMASRAVAATLTSTCSSGPRSACTGLTSGATLMSSRMCSPRVRSSRWVTEASRSGTVAVSARPPLRPKASSWCASRRPRVVASTISVASWWRVEPGSASPAIISADPATTVNRLLKSCAMPPMSWPRLSSRRRWSSWRLRPRACSCSVTSLTMHSAPPGWPGSGAAATCTQRTAPSARTSLVLCTLCSPCPHWASHFGRSASAPGARNERIDRPGTWSLGSPSRVAIGSLTAVVTPSGSSCQTPSSAVSTIRRYRSSQVRSSSVERAVASARATSRMPRRAWNSRN